MASAIKPQLLALKESCKEPTLWARTSQEVELESTRVFKLCLAAFKDESESTPETLVEVYKTWAHYQPATVVLAFLTKLIGKLEMLTSVQAPNKVIRFIYTLFDELFARTVEEEDEIIFIVRSVTLQLQMAISPETVSIAIPLLRHLVRFSAFPTLRTLYNNMYDVKDFYCTEFLGRGQFAEVLKGYNKHSGQGVALKKMKFSTVSKGLQAALLREAAVMSKMANAGVVRLYDSFQEDVYLYLVMEYSPLGDMEGYMEKKQGKFELGEISHILRELSNGLRFLRSQSIVHRDLKPANVLLFNKNPTLIESREIPVRFSDLALKLTDFTMARRLDDGELAKTVCGSPLYMAPEVLNRRQYTDKADLWSVGVILFRLIFNTMPFNGLNELDLRDNLNHKPVPIPENDPRLTPVLSDLLSGLLQKDPFLRIDWEEFFMHPFLRPPRLGSTIMTDESLNLSNSTFLGSDGQDSHLTSISAQDAIELQRQIRDYESRLQQAQMQVKQLIGDLEQSKLRELLRERQGPSISPSTSLLPPNTANFALPQSSANPANPSPSGNGATGQIQFRTAAAPITALGPPPQNGLAQFPASHALPSAPHNADPKTGTIKFSEASPSPGAAPSSSYDNQNHLYRGGAGSQARPSSQPSTSHTSQTSNYSTPTTPDGGASTISAQHLSGDFTQLAISTLSEKLSKLANSSSSFASEPASSKSAARNNSMNGSNASNNGSSVIGDSPSSRRSSQSIPENVAAQSNIQLLLSQIHPDRAVAIDIVQHLLAEVLVEEEEMNKNNSPASFPSVGTSGPVSSPISTNSRGNGGPVSLATLGVPKNDSSGKAPASHGTISFGSDAHTQKGKGVRSEKSEGNASNGPNHEISRAAVASSSQPRAESSKQVDANGRSVVPYGMSTEEWELEKEALLAEGEQWRQLFSQASNDNEVLTSQLNEAKTMVAVLEDDLKDKSDRLANLVRLEQEYTRSTIYLEDQLKSSRERVNYLEAEFQALDAYRSQMRRN